MSKHRSKSRYNDAQNNNPMGINPQMLQMLGLSNDDIQRINGIMNSMGSDGFDINSLGNLLNPNGGMNNNMNNNQNANVNSNNFNNLNNNYDNANKQNSFDNSQGNMNNGFNSNQENNNNFNNMDFSYLLSMLNNMNNPPNYMNNNTANYMNNNINNSSDNFSQGNNFNDQNSFNENNQYNNYSRQEYEDDIDVEIIEPELDLDPNISMLKAIKGLVNDDRKKFLKRVIEMYENGEIIY